jgi:hypothetical protein
MPVYIHTKERCFYSVVDTNQVVSECFYNLCSFTELDRFFIHTDENGLFRFDADNTTRTLPLSDLYFLSIDTAIVSSNCNVLHSSNQETIGTNSAGVFEGSQQSLDFGVGNLRWYSIH